MTFERFTNTSVLFLQQRLDLSEVTDSGVPLSMSRVSVKLVMEYC